MRALPSIGIVIVNWRRPDYTARCLESLAALDLSRVGHIETLVVDNESDGTLDDTLRGAFPDVRVVENRENAGLAAALNQGARELRATSPSDYLWFINNDVVVDAGALSALVDALERDPHIGVAGPLVYHPDQRSQIEQAGFRVSHWTGRHVYLKVGIDLFRNDKDNIADVDSAYGCANLVRRVAYERAGGFDPRFNLYFEETDFNVRVRRHGFRVVVVKDARVFHREGGTMNQFIVRRAWLLLRNLVRFQWKHASPLQYAVFVPYFLLLHLPYFVVWGSVYAVRVRLAPGVGASPS